jgi:hypothetical protein
MRERLVHDMQQRRPKQLIQQCCSDKNDHARHHRDPCESQDESTQRQGGHCSSTSLDRSLISPIRCLTGSFSSMGAACPRWVTRPIRSMASEEVEDSKNVGIVHFRLVQTAMIKVFSRCYVKRQLAAPSVNHVGHTSSKESCLMCLIGETGTRYIRIAAFIQSYIVVSSELERRTPRWCCYAFSANGWNSDRLKR